MESRIRVLILFVLFLTGINGLAQTTIWLEDFTLLNGTTVDNGATAWSRDVTAATLDPGDYFEVQSQLMEGRDLDGEVIWTSQSINISAFTDVSISIDVTELGNMEASDYIRAFYILDGSGEIQFGEVSNDITGGATITLATGGLNGTNLTVVVRMLNNGGQERWQFDNVLVSEPAAVFSIASGNWSDGNNWSYTATGPACGCSPSAVAPATIQTGDIIDIDVTASASDLTVETGATLRWTTGGGTLTISDGSTIDVQGTGSIERNGNTAALLVFSGDATVNINDAVNGVSVENVRFFGNVTFSGNGIFTVNDDLLIDDSSITITNGLGAGMNITDRLHFVAGSVSNTFINNGPLTVGTDLRFNDDSCLLTNNDVVTLTDDILVVGSDDLNNAVTNNGTLNLNQVRLNNATGFVLTNNGTITMSDDFLSTPVGAQYINAAGAIWNYGGNNADADATFDASATNNLIVFNGTGNLTLVPAVTSYYNLEIAGSGTFTTNGVTDINGYLQISSTLNINSNLNLAGDFTSTGTFTNLANTFTFDGGNQQITANGGSFSTVDIAGTGIKTLNSNTDVDLNFTVNSTLAFGSTGLSLNVGGDWRVNGTFTQNDETVVFDGTAAQDIRGDATFSNIDINKGSGVLYMESNSTLEGLLTFQTATEFDADGIGNGRIFTMAANASGKAMVGVLPAGASISGNVTFQEYFPSYGAKRWRYISSPVLDATVADLQNEIPISGSFTGSDNGSGSIPLDAFGSLAYYDNTTGAPTPTGGIDDRWVYHPASINTEALTSTGSEARGFAIWIRETGEESYDLRGTVNQGNIDFQLNGSNEMWNLVGNPYPATIDWDGAGWTKTSIQGNTIHVWDGDQWLTWNGTVGSLGTGLIAKGQAFWIQGSAANVNLQTTEAVKSTTSRAHVRLEEDEGVNLELVVRTGQWEDKTHVFVDTRAGNEFEIYDAVKRGNSIFNLSTLSEDGMSLTINAMEELACGTRLPVGLTNTWNGTYSFSWDIADIPSYLSGILHDYYTDESYDMRQFTEFSFEVNQDASSKGLERFEIEFVSAGFNSELNLATEQNCETLDPGIVIGSSVSGLKYEILYDNQIIGEITGTGSELSVPLDASLLANGLNVITVQASAPSCGLALSDNVEVEKLSNPLLVLDVEDNKLYTEANGTIEWFKDGQLMPEIIGNELQLGSIGGEYHIEQVEGECRLRSEMMMITGIQELKDLGVEIYPNPVVNILNVQTGIDGIERAEVLDISGRVFRSTDLDQGLNRIDLNNLKSGSYILRMYSADKTYIHKFIKD